VNATESETTRFVIDEDGFPWEVGPGFLKMVGAAEPKSDESRARLTDTILSDAEEVTEAEALRVREELNAAAAAEDNA
jgi:hypothetical protein